MSISALLYLETPKYKLIPIDLFGQHYEIYYYAICIVLGLALATCLTALMMHRKNISSDMVLLAFVVCVPCAIIGARLFSSLTDPNIGIQNFLRIHDGGLSIFGGIFGGVLGLILLCLIKRINFFRIADCIACTFPLAQSIGRWGNYFNQEVYGTEVTNKALQFFPVAVNIDGESWHYAFFFYESVANLVWFFVLYIIAWNLIKKPNGIITGLFFAFYGVIRAVMEPLRDSQFILGAEKGLPFSSYSAYLLIAAGLLLIVGALIVNKCKEGKFIGSKNGDPYTVTKFLATDKKELPAYSPINAATKLKKDNF